jgi:hypothetical protein
MGALTLYLGAALFSCQGSMETAKEIPEETLSWRVANQDKLSRLYPNGGEELAWIMREVTHRLEAYKVELQEGKDAEVPDLINVLEEIHGAKSIRKEAGTPPFNGMTTALIQNYETLQKAGGEEVISSFNALIQNCENCHQAYCPGPLKRIQKLKFEG